MSEFLMMVDAAELSGLSIRKLLSLGADGELSIYAQGDWFWCQQETPDQLWNVSNKIFLNDLDQIKKLARGEQFQLHIDGEGRFISRRDCIDNEYLDGVTVKEINLYCLKTEIQEINDHDASKTDVDKARTEVIIAGVTPGNTGPKEREVTAWLRETWNLEGKPGGTAFFVSLKKHVNKAGSPIVEHYSAGKDAGIRWHTSAGSTGEMRKKTIQTKVSIFNSTP